MLRRQKATAWRGRTGRGAADRPHTAPPAGPRQVVDNEIMSAAIFRRMGEASQI